MNRSKINWKKHMHLLMDADTSNQEIADIIGCSRDVVRTKRRQLKASMGYTVTKPTYNYLADMRAGFPQDVRPLEGLSHYWQGSCEG